MATDCAILLRLSWLNCIGTWTLNIWKRWIVDVGAHLTSQILGPPTHSPRPHPPLHGPSLPFATLNRSIADSVLRCAVTTTNASVLPSQLIPRFLDFLKKELPMTRLHTPLMAVNPSPSSVARLLWIRLPGNLLRFPAWNWTTMILKWRACHSMA